MLIVLILLFQLLSVSRSVQPAVEIHPYPTADREFVYVQVGSVYQGTPLVASPALLPAVRVVVARDEDPITVRAAADIATAIAHWADDPGVTFEQMQSEEFPQILRFESEITATELEDFNLIVVGLRNKFARGNQKELQSLTASGKPIILIQKSHNGSNRDLMFIAGTSPDATQQAARYLAHQRLYFKTGAYQGLFGFVRLRGYLESENYKAAGLLLQDPHGVRGCGKPVMVALPGLENKPEEFRTTAQHRNQLVFEKIHNAIAQKDKQAALEFWQQTMTTCYACHQGRGTAQYRKFVPPDEPHYMHSLIAVDEFGIECQSCHFDGTERAGYTSE